MYGIFLSPVFEGLFYIGKYLMLVLLMYRKHEINWEYYSSVVVADMDTFRKMFLSIKMLRIVDLRWLPVSQ